MANSLPRDAGEAAIAWISKVLGDMGIIQGDMSADFASSNAVKDSLIAYIDKSKRSNVHVIHFATQAWSNVLKQSDLIRNLKKQNGGLSAKLIETQGTLIKVQGQLVDCKDEQFHGISTAVQLSVRDSMKKEMTSYSTILHISRLIVILSERLAFRLLSKWLRLLRKRKHEQRM